MNEINADQLIRQMRIMAEKVEGLQPSSAGPDEINDFSSMLKNSIDKVNEIQMEAGKLATRFDAGDKDVNMAEVMVNLQKASVSFQAMTQVRNRLVTAYQDIMNMQI